MGRAVLVHVLLRALQLAVQSGFTADPSRFSPDSSWNAIFILSSSPFVVSVNTILKVVMNTGTVETDEALFETAGDDVIWNVLENSRSYMEKKFGSVPPFQPGKTEKKPAGGRGVVVGTPPAAPEKVRGRAAFLVHGAAKLSPEVSKAISSSSVLRSWEWNVAVHLISQEYSLRTRVLCQPLLVRTENATPERKITGDLWKELYTPSVLFLLEDVVEDSQGCEDSFCDSRGSPLHIARFPCGSNNTTAVYIAMSKAHPCFCSSAVVPCIGVVSVTDTDRQHHREHRKPPMDVH